jgi:branched-chain amino acid transport system permease protein
MAALVVRQGSRTHRGLLIAVAVLVAAAVVALPLVVRSASQIGTLSQLVAYSVAILGLILLMGYCGQISVGHGAFVGIGAYTTVILVVESGWPFLATVPVAVVVCMAAGFVIGLPALRIQGLYLVTVTIAVAALFPVLVMQFEELTGGANGKVARRPMAVPEWFFLDERSRLAAPTLAFYVIVIIAALAFLLARNLVRSRIGRAMVAIKNSPISAASAGVPVSWVKVWVFSISAGYAGLAGSLLAIQLPTATESRFNLDLSIFLLVAAIVGGARSIWGALPGAVVLVVLRTWIADWAQSADLLAGRPDGGQIVGILAAALLLAVVFGMPAGLIEGLRALGRRLVRVEPRPPSADATLLVPAPDRPPAPTPSRT